MQGAYGRVYGPLFIAMNLYYRVDIPIQALNLHFNGTSSKNSYITSH